MKSKFTTALIGAIFAGALPAASEGLVDPSRAVYLEAFEGKTVAFVPMSMGFDLTQAWGHQLQSQAEELGYDVIIRDPNWSTEAGAQALTQLISEKPDIIVVQNPDIQSYARLLRQAEAQGIYTLQVNMKSAYPTDGFAGVDYNGLGEKLANLVVGTCGEGSGKSGKISIVQGVLTGGASVYQTEGLYRVLNDHPEIEIVSDQAADWDATKAKAITETVLQQNPDLCAVIGYWDGMDIGIAAAVREAGKSGEVAVMTSGGGNETGCENVRNGGFDAYFNYDAMGQGRDLNAMIKDVLQTEPGAGKAKVINYSSLTLLTADSLKPNSCWSLEN